ncbi:MAG TPA: hypothetical protein VH206_02585 [Xanthobacteraceae bacterium]|jgi:hypothetical protein|nr:hypothetical protein [Xanthobacteraceae bacterium]
MIAAFRAKISNKTSHPPPKWTGFMAVLWLLVLAGCSELAAPAGILQPGVEPPYVSLAAKHLQSVLKDQASYDSFEIAAPRWVHSIGGWSFLTCVHFRDHGRLKSYALFLQNDTVIDARFAVETDACEAQSFVPFDLVTGTLGHTTAPTQPPLY